MRTRCSLAATTGLPMSEYKTCRLKPDYFSHLFWPFQDLDGVICLNSEVKYIFLGMLFLLHTLSAIWFVMIGSVASGGRTVASRSSSAPKPTTARRRLMGVEHREELLIRIGCEKQIGDWNAWHSPSQQKSGRQGTNITDEPQHQHTSSIARDIKKQQGLLTGLPFP